MSGPERLNASTLLDANLEAGRADAPALLTADGTITYRELAGLTGAVASYLTMLDVEREQRILMILDDSPAFPAAFLGAMRIGAVPVPVNPMDRVDNYAYYLDDSYARVLFVEASLLPALEATLARAPGAAGRRRGRRPGPARELRLVRRQRRGSVAAAARHPRARTWRSGSTARARPAGPRASCTPTATSA